MYASPFQISRLTVKLFTSLYLPSSSKYKCNVYNATYNSVAGCSKTLITAPYKETEKTSKNKIK